MPLHVPGRSFARFRARALPFNFCRRICVRWMEVLNPKFPELYSCHINLLIITDIHVPDWTLKYGNLPFWILIRELLYIFFLFPNPSPLYDQLFLYWGTVSVFLKFYLKFHDFKKFPEKVASLLYACVYNMYVYVCMYVCMYMYVRMYICMEFITWETTISLTEFNTREQNHIWRLM